MEMLRLVTILPAILLMLSGVLTQLNEWGVTYPEKPICAVRGFNVTIPCNYYYPKNSQGPYLVTKMLWCSMNENEKSCTDPPYVYNSASNNSLNFVYLGNNISVCTLLIHNLQSNYSGVYKFRFITNVPKGKWTGEPGVTLQVEDLKVSLSGNGTLKQGDSLNLTCDVNCTHSSSQFVWSKNNMPLKTSGPVLHFPDLTVRDSGNYTCTWETNETSGSKTISLYVEGENVPDRFPVWIIAVVTSLVMLIILVIFVAVIYNMRRKDDETEDNKENEKEKQVPQPNEEVPPQEEVTYASVFVRDNKPNNGRDQKKKEEEEDISVIYSAVMMK